MKKIILTIIICVTGGVLLLGGTVFALYMNDIYTVSFDNYMTFGTYASSEDFTEEEMLRYEKCKEEQWISYPSFSSGRGWGFVPELTSIYAEVDNACVEYAHYVVHTYNNNARLNFTVENTGKILTIKFSGVGYPENGEPEELSRTYIFDIEGAGVDKLPKLLNRADIIGY